MGLGLLIATFAAAAVFVGVLGRIRDQTQHYTAQHHNHSDENDTNRNGEHNLNGELNEEQDRHEEAFVEWVIL